MPSDDPDRTLSSFLDFDYLLDLMKVLFSLQKLSKLFRIGNLFDQLEQCIGFFSFFDGIVKLFTAG